MEKEEQPITATEVAIEEMAPISEAQAKKEEERKNNELLLAQLIPPHDVVSREVKEDDLDRVVKDSVVLYNLCFAKSPLYNGAFAMSHAQITKDDPLRFFVTSDRQIIINPVITRHSNYVKDSKEACMSFLMMTPKIIQRWQKCEVEFQSLVVDPENDTKFKLSEKVQQSLSGHKSFEFQHEIDHYDAIYMYPLLTE